MSPQQREQIRLSVLRYCESAGQYGLSAELLHQFLRGEGFRAVTIEQVHSELQYLTDKALVWPVTKLISPENPAWRITAPGRDYLAVQNF
jgi:hypothetical protein